MATHLGNVDHSLPFYQFHHCDDTSLSLSASPNNIPITTTTSWSSFASSESVLSSPVASEVGSTETESHPDDDFMAELTRQMTHFMFQDDDKLEKVVNLSIKLFLFLCYYLIYSNNLWFAAISVLALGLLAAINALVIIRHGPREANRSISRTGTARSRTNRDRGV